MRPNDVLGVRMGAGRQEVKAAYRRYARLHHPDRGGDPAAFRAGVAAYRALLSTRWAVDEGRVVFHHRRRGLGIPIARLAARLLPGRFFGRKLM